MSNNIKSFQINQNQKKIIENNFFNFLIKSDNEFIENTYKSNNWTIVIYKSQKCVISGKNIEEILKILDIKQINFTSNEIGMDEVGVGDYFGGIVVCSVFLNKETFNKIQNLDIKDSKKLNDSKIVEIAKKLIKIVDFEISQVLPKEYNLLIDKFNNSHIIKTILHNNAIFNLINNHHINLSNDLNIILDKYVDEKKYYEYLQIANIKNIVKINQFKIHAESTNLSVACASIIARYYFLKQIHELSKELNFKLPLGAWNNKIEEVSKKIIDTYGREKLNQYVKIHFKNTNKL